VPTLYVLPRTISVETTELLDIFSIFGYPVEFIKLNSLAEDLKVKRNRETIIYKIFTFMINFVTIDKYGTNKRKHQKEKSLFQSIPKVVQMSSPLLSGLHHGKENI
jgi:hypothetical protein